MGRQIFLVIISYFLITIPYTQAQVEYNTVQNVRIYAPGFTPYKGVEGSPYVPDDSAQNGWLVNGTRRISVRLRYNSYTGEVEYVEGSKILTPANSIAEFAILASDTMYFRRGFPAVGLRTADNFYQILFNGRKTKLVRYVFATVKSNTESMSNDFGKKEFQKREEYYVWVASAQPPTENYFEKLSTGEMKPVTLSKKLLVSLFPENTERIDHYLADKKIKLKSWTEFASVLKYLDTI